MQPPTKKLFLPADEKTGQSIWTIKQLTGAIGGGAVALVKQPKTAGLRPKTRYDTFTDRLSMC